MTKDVLERGVFIQEEIQRLQHFVNYYKNCWKILRINRYKKIGLETSYGALFDSIIISPELAARILDTIEKYITEKQEEFDKLGVDMREAE